MRIDARSGIRGRLIDLDTGKPIPLVQWFDTETGIYCFLEAGSDGKPRLLANRQPIRRHRQGRVRFIEEKRIAPLKPSGSPFEDLVEEVLKGGSVIKPELIEGIEVCEYPGCRRRGTPEDPLYETCEEVEVEPYRETDGKLYQRAVTTRIHRWCQWHYQLPIATSLRGVTNEVEVAVRPQ